MKKFFLFCLTIVTIVSCSDELTEFDGKWQLKQIESGSEIVNVDTVFYNIQASYFQYQIYIPQSDNFICDYGYTYRTAENLLTFELLTPKFIEKTDWTSKKKSFKVEEHTKKKLILSSEGKTYYFRRF